MPNAKLKCVHIAAREKTKGRIPLASKRSKPLERSKRPKAQQQQVIRGNKSLIYLYIKTKKDIEKQVKTG